MADVPRIAAGQLDALKLTGLTDAEQMWVQATYTDKVGAFEWVALDMDQVVIDADKAADAVAATEFGRPEDVDVIGPKLYVANTTGQPVTFAARSSTGTLSPGVHEAEGGRPCRIPSRSRTDTRADTATGSGRRRLNPSFRRETWRDPSVGWRLLSLTHPRSRRTLCKTTKPKETEVLACPRLS